MRWEPHGVCLVPALDFLTKNQSASIYPPEIFVPDITKHSGPADDKFWCPVRTLKWYLAGLNNSEAPLISCLSLLSGLIMQSLETLLQGGLSQQLSLPM